MRAGSESLKAMAFDKVRLTPESRGRARSDDRHVVAGHAGLFRRVPTGPDKKQPPGTLAAQFGRTTVYLEPAADVTAELAEAGWQPRPELDNVPADLFT